MNIKKIKFKKLSDLNKEGIIFLGCGGDLQELVIGITKTMFNDGVISYEDPKDNWSKIYVLKTTEGRTDLCFIPNKYTQLERIALWRLRFGKTNWVSDYLVNYRDHHEA